MATRFVPFHGNYCGPGNRGGAPIDALDSACMIHDSAYGRALQETGAAALRLRILADLRFIRAALKVATDSATPGLVRIKAAMAARYFVRCIRRDRPLIYSRK